MSDIFTLYKLIILYMLDRVSVPLTNAQISGFVLEQGYTTYFTLQQAFSELVEAGLLSRETIGSSSFYRLTKEGEKALGYFEGRISKAIRNDVIAYLAKNHLELKDKATVVSDYRMLESREYAVRCQVREKRSNLIDITLTVPTEEDAIRLAGNWKEKSQEIYQYVMTTLFRESEDDAEKIE